MNSASNWISLRDGVKTVASDVVDGFVAITHSSVAILGLGVLLASAVLATQPQLRTEGETALRTWLQDRQIAATGITPELTAIERATATNPADLPKEQAQVAYWIAKKYKVAPEPLAALVAEAYDIGQQAKLEPTLLLAIMAIESSFNPFAQSPVGAQGLMQVMTSVHADKYGHYGGTHAAFDPRSNLRVGAQVLQECIQRAGSLRGGLKHYVGAANLAHDGGYGEKVMREFQDLYRVAKGKALPGNFEVTPRAPLTAQAPATSAQTVALRDTGLSHQASARAAALSYVDPVDPSRGDQLAAR
ncbi:lytic transglycosylase [Comamonas serinivorans]|uniref:Lytic transglycosylase n=1 Tax=Comamonas serinivorans TaxID=1082851 RepID=A0A1Y0EP11_9BURK|nr:lytic transglycosylase domain-containing protein [Comamonas serinivorans]ARU05198.1 lytic transglycosylase [Comamonas serinivorans]